MKKFASCLLLLSLFCTTHAFSQLSGWTQRMPIQVIDTTGIPRSGYTLLLRIDTQTPVNNGLMNSNGDDIRFGDPCAFTLYPHWIEDYMNSDTTLIWVRVDTILANDTLQIAMFYGNPGAGDGNDFGLTFPNRLITGGGDITLTGDQSYDWLQVDAGDTLFLGVGDTLEIRARRVQINGVVWGQGKGFQNGAPNTAGAGPGGGGYSAPLNSGAGGGGYGGNGGTGGYDSGDTPGTGGTANGTLSGTDINMGSAGGSSDNTPGGDGGGGLFIDAEIIICSGKVDLSGTAGTQPGSSRGGGGGAGGGLLLSGRSVKLTGANISSQGGNGSTGSITANDSGGGGSGGRLKVRSTTFAPASTFTVNGGTGGPYGDAAPGQAGASGTTSILTSIAYPTMVIQTMSQENYTEVMPLSPSYSDADLILCPGDALQMNLNSGYDQYDFYQDGLLQGSGPTESFTFSNFSVPGWVHATAASGSCVASAGDSVAIHTLPALSLTASDSSACNGNADTLAATAGFVSYLWTGGAATSSLITPTGGTFEVTVTDANGCTQMQSITISDLNFTALISTNDSTPCTGEMVTLTASGGSSPTFVWSTTQATASIDVSSSNTYAVTLTSSNGCIDDASVTLTFNTPPVVNITDLGGTLDAGPGFTSYQWFLNGNILSGETNQTTPGPSAAGISTYVVVVTDANGCTASDTISFNLAVNEGWLPLPVSIAPNPTSGQVNLLFELEQYSLVQIQITDLTGRVMHAQADHFGSGKQQWSMDLSEWPAALYLLSVQAGDRHATLRVVKD